MVQQNPKAISFPRMNGETQSGYTIQDNDASYLSIAKCKMDLPYFDEDMEEHVGTIAIKKPARFVVEENGDISWSVGAAVTFSNVIDNNDWNISMSTGIFSPRASGTFMFVVDGTVLKTDAMLAMTVKSGLTTTTEYLYETSTGIFDLTESSYQLEIYR